MERRLHTRHHAATRVYLSAPGYGFWRCHAQNVSSAGVFLEDGPAELPRGTEVELIFAVSLGRVTRIHRRQAVVAHISSNGTGLMMKGYSSNQNQTRSRRAARSKA
ncbi:MAG: PilZ domain-containing protein [Chromatiales bacterium]|nr:PilZ domain-containing protein [Chromatiales bacterium]